MAIVNSYVSLPDGYSGHIPHATEEVPYISVCGISLGDYQDPKCRNPPSLENHLPEGWQFHSENHHVWAMVHSFVQLPVG